MNQAATIVQTTKDPAEKLPYGFDWVEDLDAGESISSSVWTIETTESPVTLVAYGTPAISGTTTSAGYEGGAIGKTYLLTNTITTSPSGFVHRRRIEVRILKK